MWEHKHGWDESKHSKVYLVVVHGAFAVVMAALLALGFGYLVMLLWNAVLPAVSAVHHITYWQSVGLLLLARILVGGFGRHGHGHGHGSRQRREAWRDYEAWWRETGRQSFDDFSQERGGGKSE